MSRTASVLGTLAWVSVMISAYIAWQALSAQAGLFAPLPTVIPAGTTPAPNASTPDLLQLRFHYCSGGRSYALLSLPLDATFHMSVGTSDAMRPKGDGGGPGIPITGAPAIAALGEAAENRISGGACAEVGKFDGRKLVLCWGQAPTQFTIMVSNSLGSQAYALPLLACGTAPAEPAPDRIPGTIPPP